ncbi:MAG: PEP-CTERM sorting domain-containing protein [Hydrogenophaga sp.]|uniref:PEP-CTERM sorting domain-containing protein n=1 Tax=Hydrogenophaga sp. TaxID=1904254 RepID=UPI00257A0767|nr:PEP-CTERM sorting domain-containing protein [Hydrogenophaga sp.]MBL0943570.1 PEP-CTERM sorting domain-containing protein [Hydrogenophaga sp.]
MKLKLIAAAAAFAAAGAAHAAIALPTATGNSDLVASFYSVASNSSVYFDLGVSMSDFAAATGGASGTGIKLVWDLDAGTFQDLSAAATGLATQAINYGSVFTSFLGEVSLGDVKFDVKAGDRQYSGLQPAAGAVSLLTTSAAPTVSSTNSNLLTALTNLNTAFGFMNGDTTSSTHSDAAGANKFDEGDNAQQLAYLNAQGENIKVLPFQTAGSIANPLNMFLVSYSTGINPAAVTTYAGQWSFDSVTNQLIYATAPVPEPEAFAMLLAGLGLMGAIARRRRTQA